MTRDEKSLSKIKPYGQTEITLGCHGVYYDADGVLKRYPQLAKYGRIIHETNGKSHWKFLKVELNEIPNIIIAVHNEIRIFRDTCGDWLAMICDSNEENE